MSRELRVKGELITISSREGNTSSTPLKRWILDGITESELSTNMWRRRVEHRLLLASFHIEGPSEIRRVKRMV
jgi:hypothetical protein